MMFKNLNDAVKFFEVVDRCEGSVWMENVEGVHVDLKNKELRNKVVNEILSGRIDDMEVFARRREDIASLVNYISMQRAA